MGINFGNLADVPTALRYALGYMYTISLFGVTMVSWLTVFLGFTYGASVIKNILNRFGIFNTAANRVAGEDGFSSDAEKHEFAQVDADMDDQDLSDWHVLPMDANDYRGASDASSNSGDFEFLG